MPLSLNIKSMGITGEWLLLQQIKELIESNTLSPPKDLLQGIGDDCAVFAIDRERCGIITTDMCVENVHFRQDFSSPGDIGYKLMTANISDISSMAGWPKFAFVSLGVPPTVTEDFVKSLYSGMLEASVNGAPCISGGDLSRSEKIVINITVYGEALLSDIVYRSGARSGDHIYCTGTLGGSHAGLKVLTENLSPSNFPGLVNRHLRPQHRLSLIPDILKHYRPSAMIDISDGLLSDLRHICEASHTGFQINAGALPLHPELPVFTSRTAKDPVACALKSGEEYELLFTSPVDLDIFPELNKHGIDITKIGFITDRDYVLYDNGNAKKIEIIGYDHFT